MDREAAQKKIRELIDKFYRRQKFYESAEYNEAQCRQDFINPLFAALGWDIENEEDLSPSYRAVRLENRLVRDGTSRALDYSFWIGKEQVFIVEAKKPSVHLQDGTAAKEAAFQLRRYGWSAKLNFSIVTNFKEIAVYDCTQKPKETDQASTARLAYLSLTDCVGLFKTLGDLREGFDYLWETFGYDSVRRGSLENYIQENDTKKGILTVDDSFLQFLESHRKLLATAIFRNNKKLTERDLDFAVQQIIDRIVFLRFAEDRGIEHLGGLAQAVKTMGAGECYKNIYEQFESADDKYNSGLFDMGNDHICRHLVVDNTTLKNFISGLYFPSPYDFQAMPVEILGSAYERFLGKTIRISGRSVSVEEKPEVRKAGGVYYTPQNIVDYIVENTVGRLLEGKTPKGAAKITIVDPACGSGSFLLGAYQYLLDWHRNYYTEHLPPSKRRKTDPLTPDGHLTIEEKKRILANNIFGVDLDNNAVEITKLSLLLKCMEGETSETVERLKIYHERLLPNIDGNIRCGNSLVGNDFYTLSHAEFDENEQVQINAFDWHREFPAIFQKGGFDIVIGNPPWGQKAVKFDEIIRLYFSKCYPASSVGILDLFRFFIEKALMLLRDSGLWGQVLPDIVLMKNYESTRRLILDTATLQRIDHWGTPFSQANIEVCTLIGTKGACARNKQSNVQTIIHLKNNSVVENRISQNVFRHQPGCKFNILLTKKSYAILRKFETLPVFGDFFAIHEGIHTGNARDLLFVASKIDKHCKRLIFGRDEVQRYLLKWGGSWVHYTKDNFGKNHYANLCKPEFFETKKIIIRRTGSFVLACLDEYGYYFSNNVFVCLQKQEQFDLRFFLGLLNSSLLTWYYQNVHPQIGSAFPEIKINLINRFPVPRFDLTQKSDKANYDRLVSLVNNMLQFKEREQVLTLREREIVQRRIASTESEINSLVYELYGLTADEIAIVKGMD